MKTTATLAAATVAIALAFPTAASADRNFFNVTVGGPGYAVSVGNAGWGVGGWGGVPAYPAFLAAPVVVPTRVIVPAPVFAPVFAPAPAFVAPPVVYRTHRPKRVFYAPVPVAYRPYPGHRPYVPVVLQPR
jgi:hypothetical protein